MDFIRNYKEELKYIILILLVGIIFSEISWGKLCDIFTIDNSRELVIPYFINHGKILYSEIIYHYGPLAPYLFALLTLIFGFKFSVFWGSALFIVLVFSVLLYILARQYLTIFYSILVSILFFVQIAFNSFIYPYSYNAIFASLFYAFLFAFLLFHYKTNNKKLIYLASIMMMLLLFTKQDYVISATGLFLTYIAFRLYKKFRDKSVLTINELLKTVINKNNLLFVVQNILIITFIPLIVYLYFGYISGYKYLFDLLFPFEYLLTRASEYNGLFLRGSLTIENIQYATEHLSINIIFGFLVITLLYQIIKYLKMIALRKAVLIVMIIAGLFGFTVFISSSFRLIAYSSALKVLEILYTCYHGLNILLVFMLIICLIKFKDKDYEALFLLVVAALYANYRMFWGIGLYLYGYYYLPLSIIAYIVLFTKFIPVLLESRISTDILKPAVKGYFIFITSFLTVFYLYAYIQASPMAIVETPGGKYSIYNDTILLHYHITKVTAKFIKAQTTKNNTIVVFPEDSILYLFADKLNATSYYQTFPGEVYNIQLEKRIIKELTKNKPEFIVINPAPYPDIKYGKFGSKDFAPEVYKWITKNYEEIKRFSHKPYTLQVFREKK